MSDCPGEWASGDRQPGIGKTEQSMSAVALTHKRPRQSKASPDGRGPSSFSAAGSPASWLPHRGSGIAAARDDPNATTPAAHAYKRPSSPDLPSATSRRPAGVGRPTWTSSSRPPTAAPLRQHDCASQHTPAEHFLSWVVFDSVSCLCVGSIENTHFSTQNTLAMQHPF